MTTFTKYQAFLITLGSMAFTTVGAFEAGKSNVSISAGSASYFNENYLALGIGYDYFITDGLQLGAKIDLWFDGGRDIYQVTPGINYIVPVPSTLKPYVGAFYQRNYIEGEEDIDAYGYRAGVYFAAGSRSYVGYGISYSELKDCDESIYIDCSTTHSEISIVTSF